MSAKPTGEEKEGDLKHHRQTLDEGMEWPLLQSLQFTLTVSTTLDRRPSCFPQVTVEPLLPQHRDECRKQ